MPKTPRLTAAPQQEPTLQRFLSFALAAALGALCMTIGAASAESSPMAFARMPAVSHNAQNGQPVSQDADAAVLRALGVIEEDAAPAAKLPGNMLVSPVLCPGVCPRMTCYAGGRCSPPDSPIDDAVPRMPGQNRMT
jgi:hypothetical protein